ncbi:MAG: hypothetical protein K6B14_07850 [Lachnospiraceae bacterium]|nr:hypothetical protein [Lachnospiraceae bacterium]
MEYLRNTSWDEFYDELEPAKRREIMERILTEAEDDGANELRQSLFKDRHTAPRNAVRDVDNGIWHMIVVPSNMKLQYRVTPGTKNEIRKSMKALGVATVDREDPVSVSAVYWEIRNIAKRYYTTCNGPKYARKLFGILQSSDAEQLRKTAEDVWACAIGVPEHYKMVEEMQIFSDAVRDAFFDFFDDGERVFNLVMQDKQ